MIIINEKIIFNDKLLFLLRIKLEKSLMQIKNMFYLFIHNLL